MNVNSRFDVPLRFDVDKNRWGGCRTYGYYIQFGALQVSIQNDGDNQYLYCCVVWKQMDKFRFGDIRDPFYKQEMRNQNSVRINKMCVVQMVETAEEEEE